MGGGLGKMAVIGNASERLKQRAYKIDLFNPERPKPRPGFRVLGLRGLLTSGVDRVISLYMG